MAPKDLLTEAKLKGIRVNLNPNAAEYKVFDGAPVLRQTTNPVITNTKVKMIYKRLDEIKIDTKNLAKIFLEMYNTYRNPTLTKTLDKVRILLGRAAKACDFVKAVGVQYQLDEDYLEVITRELFKANNLCKDLVRKLKVTKNALGNINSDLLKKTKNFKDTEYTLQKIVEHFETVIKTMTTSQYGNVLSSQFNNLGSDMKSFSVSVSKIKSTIKSNTSKKL